LISKYFLKSIYFAKFKEITDNSISYREIKIKGKTGRVDTIDFVYFLRAGSKNANPVIQNGDQVFFTTQSKKQARVSISGEVNAEGELKSVPKLPSKQIFSESSAHSVVKMMDSVVANGTGAAAQIDGYHIGGKTGTAQKDDGKGRYLANAKFTSFVAILPTNDPQYVVFAVVDEPQGGNTFGSTVAAPVVKEVMNSIIRVKGIPPSYPIGLKKDKKK